MSMHHSVLFVVKLPLILFCLSASLRRLLFKFFLSSFVRLNCVRWFHEYLVAVYLRLLIVLWILISSNSASPALSWMWTSFLETNLYIPYINILLVFILRLWRSCHFLGLAAWFPMKAFCKAERIVPQYILCFHGFSVFFSTNTVYYFLFSLF
jgi:hypothetical protein